MRAAPIPETWKGARVVIDPDDPTRDDWHACEYALAPSTESPGEVTLFARVELCDEARQVIAGGGVIWLELAHAQVPWQLHISTFDHPVPVT